MTQVDFDGTKSVVENIVAIEFEGDYGVSIQPNPVSGENFQLIYNTSLAGDLEVDIYSVDGRLMQHLDFRAIKNSNRFDVNVSSLSNGVYFVKVRQQNRIQDLRFVKTK